MTNTPDKSNPENEAFLVAYGSGEALHLNENELSQHLDPELVEALGVEAAKEVAELELSGAEQDFSQEVAEELHIAALQEAAEAYYARPRVPHVLAGII